MLDLLAMEIVFVMAELCIWIRDNDVCNFILLWIISVGLKISFYDNTKKHVWLIEGLDWDHKMLWELMCIYMSWDVEYYDWFNVMN